MSEDEEILLEINPAMFRNNPLGFIACVALVAAAGLGLVVLGVWWILTKADELSISNKRTIQRKGLFSLRQMASPTLTWRSPRADRMC